MSEYIENFWRDATAADVLRVMDGETVEARFRDGELDEWFMHGPALGGWQHYNFHWLDQDGSGWTQCQVYDPPQWWLNKPEPGEGYRLLNKFPDEEKLIIDEVYLLDIQNWQQTGIDDGKQQNYWYRRKIEQPKLEPKFAVGQRVRIIGPKERPEANWFGAMDEHINTTAEVDSVQCIAGEKVFYSLRCIEQWVFRADYLELVVEPEPKHYMMQVGDTAETPSNHRIKVTEAGIEVQ